VLLLSYLLTYFITVVNGSISVVMCLDARLDECSTEENMLKYAQRRVSASCFFFVKRYCNLFKNDSRKRQTSLLTFLHRELVVVMARLSNNRS